MAVELLNQTEGYEHYEEFMDGVGRIDGIVKHACKHVENGLNCLPRNIKMIKLFILWQAERVMVQHICKVYVFYGNAVDSFFQYSQWGIFPWTFRNYR